MRTSSSFLGTREQKRAHKAVPEAIERDMPAGCLAFLGVYAIGCAVLFALVGGAAPFIFALPALAILAIVASRKFYGWLLLAQVRSRWTPRGVRCLVIYSNSPNWESHVVTEWLPRIGARAEVLNWSERATWRSTLAARLFHFFCGRRLNFNPAVIVFRGLRRPAVFRFFYAFREARAGRPEYLQRLEAELFDALEVGRSF